ncbi:MAG: bifunctional DNA primase/polymerase [Microthrixaceae bacterium]
MWVLDIDVSDGKTGEDTLAELERLHGPLPATYTVITGSGGRHLYFAYPTDGPPSTMRPSVWASASMCVAVEVSS